MKWTDGRLAPGEAGEEHGIGTAGRAIVSATRPEPAQGRGRA